MRKKSLLTGLIVMMVLLLAGTSPADIYSDGFDGPDTVPDAPADGWKHRGDMYDWLVSSNTLVPQDPALLSATQALWYDGNVHTNENYQRVTLELMYTEPMYHPYGPKFGLMLNQEFGGGTYATDDCYYLEIRGNTDMAVMKKVGSTVELTSGYVGLVPLEQNTAYKITLEKICETVIATVTSLDGQIVHGSVRFVDTGTELVGGVVGIRAYYQGGFGNTEGVGYVVDNFEYELDNSVREVPAVKSYDYFSYADGSLGAQANWQRRGDKNEWVVSSNTAVSEITGMGAPFADWYLGSAHTDEEYQKVSVDFSFNSNMVDYGGWLMLGLNQDWASSGYYCNENLYKLQIRGKNDFLLAKNVAGSGDVLSAGWVGFSSNLAADTVYRAELEKDGNVLTATIYDGATVMGTSSFVDTGTELTGGLAGVIGYYQQSVHGYVLDNFVYELGESEICGPDFCGDIGTVYLAGDVDMDCQVDLQDVKVMGVQWLNTSDPADPLFIDPLDTAATQSMKIPRAPGTITVDGVLSDWSTTLEWVPLDKWYYKIGDPNDVVEAKATFCWNEDTDKVYAIVMVDETVQYFNSQYYGSDNNDQIEIYSQGSGAGGTDWSGEFDIAQQYRAAADTDVDGSSTWNGGQWYTWGTGEAVDAGVGFECVVNVSGSVTTYELGIPQFDSYEGLSGNNTTVVTQLDVDDVVGLDIIAFTIEDFIYDYGSLAANNMTGKWNDAGQFAQYTLVEELGCGDLGYWSADISENCHVNLADFVTIADQWLDCTEPTDPGCDQYWQ